MRKRDVDFCLECREEREYEIRYEPIKETIRNKDYEFTIIRAYCKHCGAEMNIPGLWDFNMRLIDTKYREIEGIVGPGEISQLLLLYNIGKEPLSAALGFGTVTINRYLSGKVPTKEYSDIIKKALSSPQYMKELLIKNKNKIAKAAFNKAMRAADELIELFDVSNNMLMTVAYIYNETFEITPLALQKLLYITEGIYLSKKHNSLYKENCEAWAHGPVYREVYERFKDFKYNPIDDCRFYLFNQYLDMLDDDVKEILDLVLETYGLYNGKVLEEITHKELPWIQAREQSLPFERSNNIISKESIESYYEDISKKYDMNTKEGINEYIKNMLQIW